MGAIKIDNFLWLMDHLAIKVHGMRASLSIYSPLLIDF